MPKTELLIFSLNHARPATFILVDAHSFLPKGQKPWSHSQLLSFSLTTVQSFQILLAPPSKYTQTLSPHSLISHPCLSSSHLIRAIIIIILPASWGSFPAALPLSSLPPFSQCWQKGRVILLRVSQVSQLTLLLRTPQWLPVSLRVKTQILKWPARSSMTCSHFISGLISYYSHYTMDLPAATLISFLSSNIPCRVHPVWKP